MESGHRNKILNTQSGSRFVANSLAMTSADFITKLALFIATVHLARILHPAGFGQYSFALSLFVYFNWVSDLGTEWVGVREVGRLSASNSDPGRFQTYVGRVLGLRLALVLLACAILMACLVFSGRMAAVRAAVLAFGPSLLVGALLLEWVFAGLERFELVAVSRVIRWISFLALVLAMVKSEADVAWAAAVYSFSFFLGALFLWLAYVRIVPEMLRPSIDLSLWQSMLVRAPAALSYTLAQPIYFVVGILLVGVVGDDPSVGVYSVASRVPVVAIGFACIFVNVLFPMIARLGRSTRSKELIDVWIDKLIVFTAPASAGLAYMADWFVVTIFGSTYVEAIGVLRWLAPTVTTISLFVLLGCALTAVGEEKKTLLGVGVGVATTLWLGAFLYRTYSSAGVGAATLAGSVAGLLCLGLCWRARMWWRSGWRAGIGVCSLVLSMALVRRLVMVDWWRPADLIPGLLILGVGVATYLVVVWVLGSEVRSGVGRTGVLGDGGALP